MLTIDTAKMQRLRDALLNLPAPVGGTEPQTLAVDSDVEAIIKRFEPFAETLYLTMMIDGESDQQEKNVLYSALHLLSNGALQSAMIDTLLARFANNLAQQGVEYRLQHIGVHLCADKAEREIAFKLAATVALANDTVDDTEQDILTTIAQYYGISSRRMQGLLEEI